MFDQGRPPGYDQTSPFVDLEKQQQPGQPGRPSPLAAAIQGQPSPAAGVPQYPPDPHMQAYVQRPAGPQPALGAYKPGQYHNAVTGAWNGDKLADTGHTSTKYVAGRVFEQFAPTPENIPKIVQALNQQGVPAKQVGFDKVDFGDGYGPVDILVGAHAGGGSYQWSPQGTGPTTATGQINPLMAAIAGGGSPQQSEQQQLYEALAQQLLGT